MKIYTISELQTEIDKVLEEAETKYQEALELIYDKNTKLNIRFENRFIIYKFIKTDHGEALLPRKVLEEYELLLQDTRDHKDKALFKIEFCSEYVSKDYPIFFWEASFLDVIDEETKEYIFKTIKCERIGEIIKPNDAGSTKTVDYKAIEMFMTGELTYKGLVKSTYKECEI